MLACSPDPSFQPGEISCWCQREPPRFTRRFNGGISYFYGALHVDQDLDRKTDDRFCMPYVSGCNPITESPARLYQIYPEYARIEWEDAFPSGAADFNDYMVGWELRDCRTGGGRYPDSALDSLPGCHNPCNSPGICDDSVQSQLVTNLKFSGSVALDESASEVPREPNGRLLQVGINLHSDYRTGDPELSVDVAICPVLRIEWRNPPGDDAKIVKSHFGATGCGGIGSGQPGSPDCVDAFSPAALPVALSREQSRSSRSCGPWAGNTESFRFEGNTSCAPDMQSFLFEVRLDDVDAALSDAALRYGALPSLDILGLVSKVDVYVFWGIDPSAQPFHCPSGPGVDIAGVEPGVAQVYRYELTQSPADPLRGPLVKLIRQ